MSRKGPADALAAAREHQASAGKHLETREKDEMRERRENAE